MFILIHVMVMIGQVIPGYTQHMQCSALFAGYSAHIALISICPGRPTHVPLEE